MNEAWTPTITDASGTLHERLLRAIRTDIASGSLRPDGKLPPHRELAKRLGIGVGTVTKAYAEAERLGLLTSTVGRGTFVTRSAAPPRESSVVSDLADPRAVIDLSLNLQSLDAVTAQISRVLQRLSGRPDLREHLDVAPHAGIAWHRQTFAEWLARSAQFADVDWETLLITNGAQQGMTLAVDTFCRPGDTILTEAVTFSGIRAIAEHRGMRCVGVAMDDEGITPEALDAAIRETGARLLYVQPTLQNPTTRTMSSARREAIVKVARRHDLMLLEDDLYAVFAYALGTRRPDLVPLATLAPERTIYLTSMSKTLAMGLRVGVVVVPNPDLFARLNLAMRADSWAASSFSSLIACQMIKDGIADDLRDTIAQEASSRMILAQRMLGEAIEAPSFPTSLHAWLPMPELRAERVANSALRRGVVLTPPSSFIVDGELLSGLRLCLNVVSRPDLERALRVVRTVLADEAIPGRVAIV